MKQPNEASGFDGWGLTLKPEGVLVSWTWFESYAISQRLGGIIGKCV